LRADTRLVATAARAYLALGVILIAIYVAIGGSGLAIDLIYQGFGTAAWIAILVGVACNRPRAKRGWLLLAAAQFSLSLADLIYFTGYGGTPPFPSIADAFYLIGAVLFGAALLALIASREMFRRDPMAIADTAVLALALGVFLWAMFFSGAFGDGVGLARAVSIAYPVLDLLLLAVLIRVLLEPGRRTYSYYLVGGSVILLVLSDAWYVVPALTDQYVSGTWRDVGWLGSYLLAGAAALHPSMRVFVERRFDILPIRRVVLLGSSMVLVSVSALIQKEVAGTVDIYLFAGVGAVMAVFITFRIAGLVGTVERMRRSAIESERRFRMVFERAPIGISVGRDGIMSETNPALHKMLGYTGEELARMHYTDVTHMDDRSLIVQQELDAGTRDSFTADKQYRRKDGTPLEARVHVSLDVVEGFGMSLIEDVTEQRALEEQLLQAQKMEAVGKLAGGIAHDFNNLMTAVIGYSELLLRETEPGDARSGKLEAIRDSAMRASDLTRQLLAFSRRQIMQTEEIDLRSVVSSMDALLRQVIGEDIHLEKVLGSGPVIVRADRTQLEQVVLNLAVNARQAMPEGGILTVAVDNEGEDAVLTVADDGIGMDAATQARIFEPFFTTKPLAEASGLGLSTVHGIIGQSGGTIEVESAVGHGTMFTVRLPRVAGERLPEVQAPATLVD
jgi:PAS domain S-box-containing protein